jgi:hypothetical protein
MPEPPVGSHTEVEDIIKANKIKIYEAETKTGRRILEAGLRYQVDTTAKTAIRPRVCVFCYSLLSFLY